MSFKGVFTYYPAGSDFYILEEKVMPLMGLGYRLRSIQWNIDLEGFHNAKDFRVMESKKQDNKGENDEYGTY